MVYYYAYCPDYESNLCDPDYLTGYAKQYATNPIKTIYGNVDNFMYVNTHLFPNRSYMTMEDWGKQLKKFGITLEKISTKKISIDGKNTLVPRAVAVDEEEKTMMIHFIRKDPMS